MTQKKKATKKPTTKKPAARKKPATRKTRAPKSEKKTEATKPAAVVSSSGIATFPAKVWESPKPFVPQKKKNWFKRLFSWF